MSTSFRKPQTTVFRSFLYLNGDEVINALSSLEGGDVKEVLTRVAKEGGSDLGGELDVKVAKGHAGKRKARRFEEELLRKRTEHSAATALLKNLHDAKAIGMIEGDYDASVHQELEEHMLIQFLAEVHLHPVHQVIAVGADSRRPPASSVSPERTHARSLSQSRCWRS